MLTKQLTPQTRLLTVCVRGNHIIQLPVRPGDTPETVMDRLSRIATPPFGEREIRQMVLRSIAMNPEPGVSMVETFMINFTNYMKRR